MLLTDGGIWPPKLFITFPLQVFQTVKLQQAFLGGINVSASVTNLSNLISNWDHKLVQYCLQLQPNLFLRAVSTGKLFQMLAIPFAGLVFQDSII